VGGEDDGLPEGRQGCRRSQGLERGGVLTGRREGGRGRRGGFVGGEDDGPPEAGRGAGAPRAWSVGEFLTRRREGGRGRRGEVGFVEVGGLENRASLTVRWGLATSSV